MSLGKKYKNKYADIGPVYILLIICRLLILAERGVLHCFIYLIFCYRADIIILPTF